jgi:hypothetical protein
MLLLYWGGVNTDMAVEYYDFEYYEFGSWITAILTISLSIQTCAKTNAMLIQFLNLNKSIFS